MIVGVEYETTAGSPDIWIVYSGLVGLSLGKASM